MYHVIDKKVALFGHILPKIDQIKNRRLSGHVELQTTCPDDRQFLIDEVYYPITKGEISVGYWGEILLGQK